MNKINDNNFNDDDVGELILKMILMLIIIEIMEMLVLLVLKTHLKLIIIQVSQWKLIAKAMKSL